jgi:P4 family phage/plasmid primase-like protien
MDHKVFNTKKAAFENVPDGYLIVNHNITKYFHVQDHQHFLEIIKNDTYPRYYEFIPNNKPVSMFFDIEIYKTKNPNEFDNSDQVVSTIKTSVSSLFPDYVIEYIVLQSHSDTKKSYHIIVQMSTITGEHVYFNCVQELKDLVTKTLKSYVRSKIVDTSVYREGLFRTIYSTKDNEQRPLIPCDHIDNELFTFVTFCQDPMLIISEHDVINLDVVKRFIKKEYKLKDRDIRDINIDKHLNCITVSLHNKYCQFIQKEHQSNHQYVIIDSHSSKQKCHDTDCHQLKFKEIEFKGYPKDLQDLVKTCLNYTPNVESAVNEQFTEKYREGNVVNIKYAKDTLTGTIINNKDLAYQHFTHTQFCRGDLLYNVNIDRQTQNQIQTMITCKKCGFIHDNRDCENNPIMYQLILNNFANENRNELSIIIDETKQLEIIQDVDLNRRLYMTLSQEDDYVCEMLYEMYRNKYMIVKNRWYVYNGTIWSEIIDEVYPQEILGGIKIIKEQVKVLYQSHHQEQNLSFDELKLLSKITDNLAKKMAKNNEDISYASASKKYFSKPGLQFNQNSHLIAFQNGVYDLNLMQFREGLPEDLLSIQLNYPFTCEPNSDQRALLNKFFEDVLPIPEVREYFLINVASCLLGHENRDQEFYILTGRKGANGKSEVCRLIERTFGEYFSAPEPTLLTKPREKANEANEALKDLIGKRIAIMSEPNKKDKILSDNLKKFTGGDTMTVRGNHERSQRMKMNLKMFMLCNTIPLLDDCKDAEIRRLSIINFPSRFCEKPVRKNEKLIDLTIADRLKECSCEFFKMLLEYLQAYKVITSQGKKVEKPKFVTKQLDDYIQRNKNDIDAYEFVETMLEHKVDSGAHCRNIWVAFCDWCQLNQKNKIKQCDLNDIIETHFDLDEKKRFYLDGKSSEGWVDITLKNLNC